MKHSWVSSVYFNCTARAVLKVLPKPKAFFLLLVLTDNWRHDMARPQCWERCYLPWLVLKVCSIWQLDWLLRCWNMLIWVENQKKNTTNRKTWVKGWLWWWNDKIKRLHNELSFLLSKLNHLSLLCSSALAFRKLCWHADYSCLYESSELHHM